jgi:hypothetical protein
MVVWGCADIYVQTRQWVTLCFCLSISNPPVGWRKEWFCLRNDSSAPLPMVTGKHPAFQPSSGYGVARKDI